jgi:dihydrofolate reductase
VVVSLVAAVAANGVIGNRGALPWRLPDDMARFRRLTLGHAVIMGRSTFASMGKPLSGRVNIVLSRTAGLEIAGCRVVHSADEALMAAGDEPEVFIIGGSGIYQLFLPSAGRLYLTWIDTDAKGDTKFPEVDWNAWRIVQETPGAPDPAWPHRFVDYERADVRVER